MGSLSIAGMVGCPVRLHGILLGRPTDVVLDADGRRVLGFVVESGDDAPRFLPFAASQPADGVIAVGSALMLLDDVAFYLKRGSSFRSLVARAGTQGHVFTQRRQEGDSRDLHLVYARRQVRGCIMSLGIGKDGCAQHRGAEAPPW